MISRVGTPSSALAWADAPERLAHVLGEETEESRCARLHDRERTCISLSFRPKGSGWLEPKFHSKRMAGATAAPQHAKEAKTSILRDDVACLLNEGAKALPPKRKEPISTSVAMGGFGSSS